MTGKIDSINISVAKGTEKTEIPSCIVTMKGIEGDAHAGLWHRQISVLDKSSIDNFSNEKDIELSPGAFGENLVIDGIDLKKVSVLDRFITGEVELEVTQIGKKCHGDACSIFRRTGECIMPKVGLFTRVIKEGSINKGQSVELVERKLKFHIITLSDRAFSGEYPDESGPMIEKMVQEHFSNLRWHLQIEKSIIPDEPELLKTMLIKDREDQVDFVITTGGTGIGPRDITPEVVLSLADMTIPGIMDHIRLVYGKDHPSALISRSVATVMGKTIVFTLPGSVKAVREYTQELQKNFEHLILMLHGIGH
ncbi:MAG TPA: molybdopterin-binding protein [bacterium]|nr:molybdopterin-binding protein [bacterium]